MTRHTCDPSIMTILWAVHEAPFNYFFYTLTHNLNCIQDATHPRLYTKLAISLTATLSLMLQA